MNLLSNPTDGSYTLVLVEGIYTMKVSHIGFLTYEETLIVPKSDKYQELKKDISLAPYQGKAIVSTQSKFSGKEIEADLKVTNQSDGTDLPGTNKSFDVSYNKTYLIAASATGYSDASTQLIIDQTDNETIEVVLSLESKKPEVNFVALDLDTGDSIAINLMVQDIGGKKTIYRNKLQGDTLLTLDFKSKYSIYAVSTDHLFLKTTLDLSDVTDYFYQDYPIELEKIKPGAKLTLDEIYFASNSTEIDESSYDELGAVYNFIRSNARLVVEIAAHTDDVGSHENNRALSEARAQAVVDLLVSKGVNAARIVGKGYGENEPIAANNSSENRSKNRRVEFRILEVK
ncbi:MAG: OmpA family protein [Bacteroidetes bacterium]|nr:OmpA family protein [Bacteroidota bacterium]